MKIIRIDHCQVEIEDAQRYRSTVFRQGDGKWKCLRCQRYRCEHAKWVAAQNPTLPDPPHFEAKELDDLIDNY